MNAKTAVKTARFLQANRTLRNAADQMFEVLGLEGDIELPKSERKAFGAGDSLNNIAHTVSAAAKAVFADLDFNDNGVCKPSETGNERLLWGKIYKGRHGELYRVITNEDELLRTALEEENPLFRVGGKPGIWVGIIEKTKSGKEKVKLLNYAAFFRGVMGDKEYKIAGKPVKLDGAGVISGGLKYIGHNVDTRNCPLQVPCSTTLDLVEIDQADFRGVLLGEYHLTTLKKLNMLIDEFPALEPGKWYYRVTEVFKGKFKDRPGLKLGRFYGPYFDFEAAQAGLNNRFEACFETACF